MRYLYSFSLTMCPHWLPGICFVSELLTGREGKRADKSVATTIRKML